LLFRDTRNSPCSPQRSGNGCRPQTGSRAYAPQAPAKAPKATPRAGNGTAVRPLGKRAAILAAAQAGKLPEAPDFSAATHTRFREKLAYVVAMVKGHDLKALKAWRYEGFLSTSPKAIQRYRDLAIIALEAQKGR
jgi:hypothetical protein